MDLDTIDHKGWALLGAAGGAGFGLVITPLIYILVNQFFGGVSFGATAAFAIANAATWGVLGAIGGVFFYFLLSMRDAS